MYCKSCGQEIPDDSEFCNYCGTNQSSNHTEKGSDNTNASKIVKNVTKKAVDVAGAIIVPELTSRLSKTGKEIGKSCGKTIEKKADKCLKRMGLKQKTPVDLVREAKPIEIGLNILEKKRKNKK